MAMSASPMPVQDVRPGVSQPALNIRTNGLPSRPNQFISKKIPDAAQLENTSAEVPERRLPPGSLRSPSNSATGNRESLSDIQPTAEDLPRTPKAAESFNPVIATVPPDDNAPLEDYIPDPEPENPEPLQDYSKDSEATVKESNEYGAPWLPPQPEPIAAPLTKVHFSCYQSHRSMLLSNNFWYPVPCMTCQRQDREVRHRCTFCCLRICTDCFQALQSCKDRSLAELMETRTVN